MDTNIRLYNTPASSGPAYLPPAPVSADSVINVSQEGQTSAAAPINTPAPENKSIIPVCGLFTLDYYKPFFNVTTSDVQERIKQAFIPNRPHFFPTIQSNPDVYGPFWIYTSLIFMLAVASNLNYIVQKKSGDPYNFDFNCIGFATSVIYSFGFILPLILNFILNIFGSKTRYVEILCIYGYSTIVFIPAALLSSTGWSIVEWALLLYAGGSSSVFLMTNLWTELEKYILNKRYIIMGLIAASQFLLVLIIKFRFF